MLFQEAEVSMEDYKKDQEGDENCFHTFHLLDSFTERSWGRRYFSSLTPVNQKWTFGCVRCVILRCFFQALCALDTSERFVTCINATWTLDICHLRPLVTCCRIGYSGPRAALTGILLNQTQREAALLLILSPSELNSFHLQESLY